MWTVTHDGPFTFCDGEVLKARFVAVDELGGMLQVESFVADSVAAVVPRLAFLAPNPGAE